MSKGVARLSDKTQGTCKIHNIEVGGKIITASGDVKADNLGVARLDDVVLADCGHEGKIVTASSTVKTNNRGTARLDDETDGDYVAKIITASGTVFTS